MNSRIRFMNLSGQQRRQLQDALMSAFPERSLLAQLLDYELNRQLNQIAQDSNLNTVVYQLIQRAQAEGWLVDLVRAAREENPGNSQLNAIALELLSPTTPFIPNPQPSAPQGQVLVSRRAASVGIFFILIAGGTTLSVLKFCSKQSTTSSKQQADNLSSEKNIDYTKLRDCLKAGQWEKADKETLAVMLKASGREKEGWLSSKSIKNFPCTDLRTIDQLWVKYSNGRFSFSIQKQTYLEVGGIPDGKYYPEASDKFGDRVGWRVKESWIDYSDVTFDTTAPVGHLPALVCFWWGPDRLKWISSLASRLVNCNI